VLERDKAALDVRGQHALPADSSVGRQEQQGRGRRRGMTGKQYNGGEAGHTQEVLKDTGAYKMVYLGFRIVLDGKSS